jgi:hypothetical protein
MHVSAMLARCSASFIFAGLMTLPVAPDMLQISASRDTTLYESATGALGNGAGQYIFAGTTNQPQLRRALIAFETGSILPENALIQSVTLRLHVASASTLTNNFSLFRMTSNWSEGASDATGNEGSGTAAMAGDATWLHSSFSDALWNSPGGDFTSTASATLSVGDLGFYSWSSAQMIADVQAWIAAPQSAFGWMLRGDESAPGTTRRFDSSESFSGAFAPTLFIEYSIVPEPGSLALRALSSLLARGRRRRRA